MPIKRYLGQLAVFQGSVASVGSAILSTDHCLNHCATSLFLNTAKTDAKVCNTSSYAC